MPAPYDHDHENEIVPFGETNFRNERRRFGIKTDDRRRHIYVLGKTGMGKTTMLENMVLADIYAGHGLAYIDPHGDTAEKIIDFVPPHRTNDVIYFNPADMDYPIGFNVLETVDERHKHLVASGLMGVFKKIWPDVWSARMEYILNNCILALLDYPGSTLLGINRLLVDREYRKRVIAQIKDPVVRTFWVDEYSSWEDRFRNEAIAPIQNKVGQFLSASIIRNIVAQVKSTIDIRAIMDERKIFIVNLAKGRIGEDNSRLLGGMLITKLQLAAMERVDIPEAERQDFYLYVDEFQNFATASFANILSEARKYRLNLIMAHQYIEQLDEDYVRPAVFGNVGTIICFRVGAKDAEFLENEFTPRFTIEDLANLTKYQIYLKLMINGVSSTPFSANTLPPIAERTGSTDKVIRVSRERYSQPRGVIEEKISRWTGMEGEEDATKIIERMEAAESKKGGKKKQLYNYVCTRCGREIQLPVKLDPSRPIYCDACLAIVKGEQRPAPSGALMSTAPSPPPSDFRPPPVFRPTPAGPPARTGGRPLPRPQPSVKPISLATLKPSKPSRAPFRPPSLPPSSSRRNAPPPVPPPVSPSPSPPPPSSPSSGTLDPGEPVSFE
ncbi:type IV secretion system DNA-binding domain-containing protein [Candidatus Uhrbacteria bacterium]|nr:type IV secretion system DNA-binding domain-containing protein [Candidatus Uhrbacteria bacterium]